METPPVIPDLSLIRRIGGGSYGDVWLARTITGVYRAVKVVDKARFADERPFLRELDGITRFQRSVGDQPRQLALMHVGRIEERGIFYYVMELADDLETGTDVDPERYEALTLKALHTRRPVLPAAEVIRIGVELARSLQGLHGAGLIHRDVKPSNIIFVAGVPKLADIGLVSSSDHTLTSLGTPGYSPPEGAGTTRADIYSLGKILYQLVTGLHTDDFPRLPTDVGTRDDVRQLLELNEVVLKACQPDPNERYATAQAMLDELLLLQAGKSVKELNAVRERLRMLGRAALWLGAAAAVVIAVLGVKHYFALKALAAQEQEARIQAEEDERRARYTSDLNQAELGLLQNDLGIARASLRRQMPEAGAPDLRGPEWHALWNDSAGNPADALVAPGGAAVQEIALAPDGSLLASREGGVSGDLVVWSLRDGSRRILAADVRGLGGFTTDGTHIVVGGPTQNVRLIDVRTGQAGPEQVTSGRLLFGAGNGRLTLLYEALEVGYRVHLWDAIGGREVAVVDSEPGPDNWRPQSFALSVDGRLLASAVHVTRGPARERQILLHDVPEKRLLSRVADPGLAETMAFSSDGRWLAVAGARAPIRLYDVGSGVQVAAMEGHGGNVEALAFSPDNLQLASSGWDQSVRLWQVPSGESAAVLVGHEAKVNRVLWSSDGRSLFSASDDGSIRVWTLPAAAQATSIAGLWTQILGDFLFLPGTNQIAATDANGTLTVFDGESLNPVRRLDGLFQPLGLTDKGGTMVALTGDRELARYDIRSSTVERTGLRAAGTERLLATAASADGTKVALAGFNGQITFFDLRTHTTVSASERHTSEVNEIAYTSDGRSAASGDRNGVLRFWTVDDGQLIRRFTLPEVQIIGLAYMPGDQSVVVGTDRGRMLVVDANTGEVTAERAAHSSYASEFVWSPDGTRLVSVGNDGFMIFWTADANRAVATIPVITPGLSVSDRGVFKVKFSPDGARLGAMTEDGRLRVWHLE